MPGKIVGGVFSIPDDIQSILGPTAQVIDASCSASDSDSSSDSSGSGDSDGGKKKKPKVKVIN